MLKANDYLSRGKFHFLKLNRIESPSFYCDISTMNPYPSISNERVYSVDMISSYYWSLVRALSSGVYYVNDSAYTLVPSVGYCSNLNKCPMDCKIRMRTLSESVYLWDIKVFNRYYKSDKLEKLLSGVCRVGNDYVTLSRDVLERFYGSEYLHFESQGVRERYCLEELCDKSKDSDLRYYINKYKLYNDKSIRVRVLVNPQLIRCKHRSYYKTLMLDDIDSIMPSVYKIGASTKKGYCVLEVTAYSEDSALKIGVKDFDRQFGGIYDNKILGLQRGGGM